MFLDHVMYIHVHAVLSASILMHHAGTLRPRDKLYTAYSKFQLQMLIMPLLLCFLADLRTALQNNLCTMCTVILFSLVEKSQSKLSPHGAHFGASVLGSSNSQTGGLSTHRGYGMHAAGPHLSHLDTMTSVSMQFSPVWTVGGWK